MSSSPTGWVPVDPPGPGDDAAVTGPSTDPADAAGTPTGWVPATPSGPTDAAPAEVPGPTPDRTPDRVPVPTPVPVPVAPPDPATDAAPEPSLPPEVPADAPDEHQPADDRQPAEVVRDAVLTAPGVVALSGGALGEVATFLPGRRVPGVRLGPDPGDPLEVHVVAAYGTPVAETAAAVRGVLAGLPASAGVAGRAVHVVVDDVALPGAPGTVAAAPGPR